MKKIPDIKIKKNSIDDEIHILSYFIYSNTNAINYIYKAYPTLAGLKKQRLEQEIKNIYTSKLTKINEKTKVFKNIKITAFLKELPKVIEIPWPNRSISAKISLCPINPRFLNTWSMNIYFTKDETSFKKTLAHEIIHFLYFEKWKKIFPDSNPKEFDCPHLIWQLSEILVHPILNDPKIKKSLGFQSNETIGKGYIMHNNFKVKHNHKLISIKDYFTLLYNKHIIQNKMSFEDFLKLSYKEIKRFEKRLKKRKIEL